MEGNSLYKSAQKETKDELVLRPKYLKDYIGQEKLKKNFEVFLGSAKKREEVLDHVLLYGPAGLGKTTLALIIANEMGSKMRFINGPSIEKSGDLVAVLASLEPGDILFIDEIHRLPVTVEEILYQAMEDFELSIVIKQNEESRVLNLSLPPFTLIGATTRPSNLSSPLLSRFGISQKLDFYDISSLVKIVKRSAKIYGLGIDEKAAIEVSKRSRGTPRIANKLLKRVRDFVLFKNLSSISFEATLEAFRTLGVDDLGLDELDVNYLKILITRFSGGPVGISSLANSLGEDKENLEEIYEPYLLYMGLINRTPKGRVASKKAYLHLGFSNNYEH